MIGGALVLSFLVAEYMFGKCYYDGTSVHEDVNMAHYWWKKAAEGGYIEAIMKLNEYNNRNR